MCADEPYVDDPVRVVDPRDDAVLVTADIENDAAVLKDARVAELRLHIAGFRPIRSLGRKALPRAALSFFFAASMRTCRSLRTSAVDRFVKSYAERSKHPRDFGPLGFVGSFRESKQLTRKTEHQQDRPQYLRESDRLPHAERRF